MATKLMQKIHKKKVDAGDFLADTIVDLCFATSYKIEELIKMPPSRRNLLIERYKVRFCKEEVKK